MSEKNLTPEQEMDVESHAPYMKIFWTLLVFTLAEYIYASFLPASFGFGVLVLGLMSMAIFKATLVGMFFMHLKFEGRWVYAMLVPAGILAIILTVALIPDVAMQPVIEENPDLEEIQTAPLQPGAKASITRSLDAIG